MRRIVFLSLVLSAIGACRAEHPAPRARTPAHAQVASNGSDAGAGTVAGAITDASAPVASETFASFPLPTSPSACGTKLAELEQQILDAPAPEGAPLRSARWDKVAPPARLDRVRARFDLRDAELATMNRAGFVVPERLAFDSYAYALHEIYQSELPIYISADAVLYAVFAVHDELVEHYELSRVAPLVEKILTALAAEIPKRASDYPPEVIADVTLYADVARALIGSSPAKPTTEAASLVDAITKADGFKDVVLFGRTRKVDFSQYAPRGHYAKSDRLRRFFRAAMWLSRLEWNLVSRSSRSSDPSCCTPNPEETPREAVSAMALADVLTTADVMRDVGMIDRGWGTLAGAREDVPLEELAKIRATLPPGPVAIGDAFAGIKKAIGDRFQRTARIHPMPEGSRVLPAIATMLGPRIVADSAAIRAIAHGEVPDRHRVYGADVAYLLGHDRAKTFFASDLATFPSLGAALDRARAVALAPAPTKDVYSAWMDAVESLAIRPGGALPSYVESDAYADLRIAEALAGYAQIKHNYVLIGGQPYTEGACAVPDGYVDPALATWDALVAYAARSAAAFHELDPKDALGSAAYFARLDKIVRVLRAITRIELAGRPLPPEALAFLSRVVEIHSEDIGTGYTTGYNGWYFDLFLTRPAGTTEPPPGRPEHASMRYAGFVADYFTSTAAQEAAYLGTKGPRLGVFVVDTGGPPRVVVGPVASTFEHHAPLAGKRLKDADVPKLAGTSAPWEASYTVPSAREPKLTLAGAPDAQTDPKKAPAFRVTVTAGEAIPSLSLTIYDHHRNVLATKAVSLGRAGATEVVTFPPRIQARIPGTQLVEMIGIAAGEYRRTIDLFDSRGGASVGLGGMRAPGE